MKSFECIAKELGYYFTGDEEAVERFLTPFNYEAIEIRLRPVSALHCISFFLWAPLPLRRQELCY